MAFWIIVVAAAARLPLVFTSLTFSSDVWRQADTASIARNFSEGGLRLLYPQINWGGAGPGYVESEFQLYPFLTAVLYRGFGEHVWLGRMVSLLFNVSTLVLVWLLARRVLTPRAALVALGFFAVSPLEVRYSTAFMPEATVLFFYVAALYLFQRWLDDDRPELLALAGASTAVAVLVKPTALNVGLVFLIMLVAQRGYRSLTRPALWTVGALSVLPATLWYLHARSLHQTYGNTFGVISGGDRKFGNLDLWTSPSFYTGTARIELEWVFAGVALPIFVVGVVVALRRRRPLLLLAGVVTIPLYFAVTARYSRDQAGVQYHVFALPYAALGVGVGTEWLWDQARRFPRARLLRSALAGVAAFFVVVCVGSYLRLFPAQARHLTECAAEVRATVPSGDLMVVSSPETTEVDGFPNNFQEPTIFFHADRYGWSLAANRHDPARLDALRDEGARWFVVYDHELVDDAPALGRYLDEQAEQVGPGLEAGCAIYRLDGSA